MIIFVRKEDVEKNSLFYFSFLNSADFKKLINSLLF